MKKLLLTLLVGMCCLLGNAQNKFNRTAVLSKFLEPLTKFCHYSDNFLSTKR